MNINVGVRRPCSRPACSERKGGARLALWMLATAGHPPQPRCVACAAEAAHARGIPFPPVDPVPAP